MHYSQIYFLGSLCVSDLSTPALQLFNYLLSHAIDYDMELKRITFIENLEAESSSIQVILLLFKNIIIFFILAMTIF